MKTRLAEPRHADTPPGAGADDSRPSPAYGIPTDDPVRALEFCRQLAASLRNPGTPDPAAPAGPLHIPIEPPQLSVVVPLFNEEETFQELHRRLASVLQASTASYEIIYVNDGSADRTVEMLEQLSATDPHVVVLDLARNFGHQVAISAGLEHATGQAVVIMDGDLQDPPEFLPELVAKLREGYGVVYAVRKNRKEGFLLRIAYAAFYRLLKRVASIDIPLDTGDFCVMSREVVDHLVKMPERNRFVRGIRSWVGYPQVGLEYDRDARYAGLPKYNYRRLFYLALDGLVSFSYIPLRVITMTGFTVSLASVGMAVFYAVKKIFSDLNPPGFTTLVVSIFFLTGVQLLTIGVIGEYIGRIHEEVKRRPLYVVRRVLRRAGQ